MEYCQLTQAERYSIASMRRQKLTTAQIALRLGRHRSTIYREVERNKTTHNGHYGAEKAHSYATARRRRCRRKPQYSQQELSRVEATDTSGETARLVATCGGTRGSSASSDASATRAWIHGVS
jgi:IS30 family transposase